MIFVEIHIDHYLALNRCLLKHNLIQFVFTELN